MLFHFFTHSDYKLADEISFPVVIGFLTLWVVRGQARWPLRIAVLLAVLAGLLKTPAPELVIFILGSLAAVLIFASLRWIPQAYQKIRKKPSRGGLATALVVVI